MNERLIELAEQATTKIRFRVDPNTYKHIVDPEGHFERVEFDKEKFAELIVRECAKLLEKEASSNHDEGAESFNVLMRESKWMKRYFGVEE